METHFVNNTRVILSRQALSLYLAGDGTNRANILVKSCRFVASGSIVFKDFYNLEVTMTNSVLADAGDLRYQILPITATGLLLEAIHGIIRIHKQ